MPCEIRVHDDDVLAPEFTEKLTAIGQSALAVRAWRVDWPEGDAAAATGAIGRVVALAGGVGVGQLNLRLDGGGAASEVPRLVGVDRFNGLFETLRSVRFEAERHGVVLAIEDGPRRGGMSAVELAELIDKVNTWAVGACVDLSLAGQGEEAAEWLTTLRQRVRAVRVEVECGGAAFDETGVEIEALGRLLGEIDFDGLLIACRGATLERWRRGPWGQR